jgi:hypothetical protein
MASLDECVVDQVREPVQLIEVDRPGPTNPGEPQQSATGFRQLPFSTLEDLRTHIGNAQNNKYTCRFMFVPPGMPQLSVGGFANLCSDRYVNAPLGGHCR